MAKRKTNAVKTAKTPILAAIKPPKTPSKKPALKFGVLSQVNGAIIIKNFSQVLQWLFNAFGPNVFDASKPEYFDTEDLTVDQTVNGSKMVDDVLAAWKEGKRPLIKCGDYQYAVTGVADNTATGARGFCCAGAVANKSGDVAVGMLYIQYDPTTDKSSSKIVTM